MISPRDKLEPRGDNEPKFNPKNKTDRKIMTVVVVSIAVLSLVAVGLFCLYYFLAH